MPAALPGSRPHGRPERQYRDRLPLGLQPPTALPRAQPGPLPAAAQLMVLLTAQPRPIGAKTSGECYRVKGGRAAGYAAPYPKYQRSASRVGLAPASTASGASSATPPMGYRNACVWRAEERAR